MKQHKKKIEFSKIIVAIFTILEIVVVIFSCVMMAITKDLTSLAYLIPSVSLIGSTGVAFYYNKAKLENKIKLMNFYKVPLTENSFNENNY